MTPAEAMRIEQAEALKSEGWRLLSRGEWDLAVDKFRQSYDLVPDCGAACRVAECLDRLKRPHEAFEWLLKALQANPRQADVALLLAERLIAQGRRDGARPYIEQALRANPNHGRAKRLLDNLP